MYIVYNNNIKVFVILKLKFSLILNMYYKISIKCKFAINSKWYILLIKQPINFKKSK